MKYNRRNFFITLWSLIIGCNLTEWKTTLFPPQKEYSQHLIDFLRKTMPNQIAYDICSVQPMHMPLCLLDGTLVGLSPMVAPHPIIFEMKAKYEREKRNS